MRHSSQSTQTPVGLPDLREPRRPLQIAGTGFFLLVVSGLGNWVKDAGLSGVARIVVDLASRGWQVAGALIALGICWLAWLAWQALRQQAQDFRDHAIRTDDSFALHLKQQTDLLRQKATLLQQQGDILTSLREEVQRLPEAVAEALRAAATGVRGVEGLTGKQRSAP